MELRRLLCAMMFGLPSILLATEVVNIIDPPNVDCGHAHGMQGDSLEFNYEFSEAQCCLWFSFRICMPQSVQLHVIQNSAKISFFHPSSSVDPCQNMPTCLYDPSDASNELAVDEIMEAGIYFILVRGVCTKGTIRIHLDRAPCPPPPCPGCLPEFFPDAKTSYIVTAWAHQRGAGADAITYDTPQVQVAFLNSTGSTIGTVSQLPEGYIIDGWQRIETEFTIPSGTSQVEVRLKALSGVVYFDDVRVFPSDGSMKCYVYDPKSLRFMAELDERHYATFYEYDGEGKLARVKKETERGIMTIQETRYNSSKVNQVP